MNCLFHYIRRAGPHAGPAPLLFFLCVFLLLLTPGFVVAQEQGTSAPQIADSILGVRIGAMLAEARAKLDPLGTHGGRDTREGGRKEAYALKETDYAHVALKTNRQGEVVWVSGFVRPDRELPFSAFGDLARAPGATDAEAIWNVETPGGGYRLVVKGQHGKARVVYLLSLATPPVQ